MIKSKGGSETDGRCTGAWMTPVARQRTIKVARDDEAQEVAARAAEKWAGLLGRLAEYD